MWNWHRSCFVVVLLVSQIALGAQVETKVNPAPKGFERSCTKFPNLPLTETPIKREFFPSKHGRILVETYRSTGFNRYVILSKHYEIYSEVRPNRHAPQDIAKRLEATYAESCKFYDVIPEHKGQRWFVRAYANAQRFQKFHGKGGHQGVCVYGIANAHDFTWFHTILVHECSHLFHEKSGVKSQRNIGVGSAVAFPLIQEGVAVFVEAHEWNRKTEVARIGRPLSGRSAAGRRVSAKAPRTFDDFIMGSFGRDQDLNIVQFLVYRRSRQTYKMLKDTRGAAMAWKDAFGTLDVPETFWKDYDAFLDLLCKKQAGGPLHDDIYFSDWPDVIRRNALMDRVVSLRRANVLLADKTPASLTTLLANLTPLSQKRTDATRKKGIALYGKRVSGMVKEILALKAPNSHEAALALVGCSLSCLPDPGAPKRKLGVRIGVEGAFDGKLSGKMIYTFRRGFDDKLLAEPVTRKVRLAEGKSAVFDWAFTPKTDQRDLMVVKAELSVTWRGMTFVLSDEAEFYPSVDKWYRLSPFDNRGGPRVDTVHPPEKGPIDLRQKYMGVTAPPQHTRRPTDIYWIRSERPKTLAPNREFMVYFPYNERAAAYAVTWIESLRDQEAMLAIGADDGLVAWVNGKRVCSALGPSGYKSMSTRAPIHLKKGMNELLVKVTQGGWGWSMGAFILDKSGDRSLRGIRYILKPGGYTKETVPASKVYSKN